MDHVTEYHKSIMVHGIRDMLRKRAVRHNDGDALESFWKLDMLPFWNGNHHIYLQLGHRLLLGINLKKIMHQNCYVAPIIHTDNNSLHESSHLQVKVQKNVAYLVQMVIAFLRGEII